MLEVLPGFTLVGLLAALTPRQAERFLASDIVAVPACVSGQAGPPIRPLELIGIVHIR